MADDILHVYGPEAEHDPVYIAGTRAGLELLRQALEQALREGRAERDTFCADGEGFAVRVCCIAEGDAPRLGLPYTLETSLDRRPEALWPCMAWEQDRP